MRYASTVIKFILQQKDFLALQKKAKMSMVYNIVPIYAYARPQNRRNLIV